MIDTSEAYRIAVDSHRQKWTVRATIDYTDYNLDNSISAFVDEDDRLSDKAQLADGIEETTYDFFAGWEHFEWGQHFRSESNTTNEKGALGTRPSDDNKEYPVYTGSFFNNAFFHESTIASDFQDYPKFSVSFSERTLTSLKVVFDTRLGEWAEEFDVNVYKGTTLYTTESIIGNTTYRWVEDLDTPILQATRVEVVVKKWNKTLSKSKIVESFTSIQEKYDTSDILEMSIYEESEPDDSTIPIGNVTANTCTLMLINENNKFDNDNEDSILAGNVMKNRRIKLFAELANQEIPLGVFYSQKWNIRNRDLEAEVTGNDLMQLMDEQEYDKNTFITPGSDQDFTYTTTADFDSFSLDNAVAEDDSLKMAGSAVLCNGIDAGVFFGNRLFGSSIFNGTQYCGTAEYLQSFNYTPGTTVTASITSDYETPIGTNVRLFASHKSTDDFTEIEDGTYIFTPEDVNESSQTVKIRVLMESQSTSVTPVVNSVSMTLSESITLYSIAAKVIDEFDDVTGLIEGNFSIDKEYGLIEVPNAYLEPQTYREIIKKIAEGGAGRAFVGRNGSFNIESLRSVFSTLKEYNNSNIFEKTQPVNPNSLYNRVTVKTQPLLQVSSDEVIAEPRIELEDGETDTITIFWDEEPAEYSSFTLPTGVDLDSYTDYTWGGEFTLINNSGDEVNETAEVNGKPYRVTGARKITLDDSESIRRNGVIEYVIEDNPLIQTVSQANRIAEIMINSFSTQRRSVDIDCLPDPSLEVSDTITVNDSFYIINKNEIEYGRGEITHIIGGKS